MKDSKGHGSNPRGAQNAGVENIDQPENMLVNSIKPVEHTLNRALVNSFRASIRAGRPIPPIEVRGTKEFGIVFDGHHRLAAYKAEKQKTIPVRLV
jgi:ParB-like chromosome segregation protein Spo0J